MPTCKSWTYDNAVIIVQADYVKTGFACSRATTRSTSRPTHTRRTSMQAFY